MSRCSRMNSTRRPGNRLSCGGTRCTSAPAAKPPNRSQVDRSNANGEWQDTRSLSREAEVSVRPGHERDHVAMRDDHALGRAGRPGGEQQVGRVVAGAAILQRLGRKRRRVGFAAPRLEIAGIGGHVADPDQIGPQRLLEARHERAQQRHGGRRLPGERGTRRRAGSSRAAPQGFPGRAGRRSRRPSGSRACRRSPPATSAAAGRCDHRGGRAGATAVPAGWRGSPAPRRSRRGRRPRVPSPAADAPPAASRIPEASAPSAGCHQPAARPASANTAWISASSASFGGTSRMKVRKPAAM